MTGSWLNGLWNNPLTYLGSVALDERGKPLLFCNPSVAIGCLRSSLQVGMSPQRPFVCFKDGNDLLKTNSSPLKIGLKSPQKEMNRIWTNQKFSGANCFSFREGTIKRLRHTWNRWYKLPPIHCIEPTKTRLQIAKLARQPPKNWVIGSGSSSKIRKPWHTVDGWNPAPPGMYKTLQIMG